MGLASGLGVLLLAESTNTLRRHACRGSGQPVLEERSVPPRSHLMFHSAAKAGSSTPLAWATVDSRRLPLMGVLMALFDAIERGDLARVRELIATGRTCTRRTNRAASRRWGERPIWVAWRSSGCC